MTYTLVVVDVDVVQPAEVLVGLQEAGQLGVVGAGLGQQLAPLALLHVPAEHKVCKVLHTHTHIISFPAICKD